MTPAAPTQERAPWYQLGMDAPSYRAIAGAFCVGVLGCSEVTVVPEPTESSQQICHDPCAAEPPFDCVASCVTREASAPTCVAGAWECPPVDGRFPSTLCDVAHESGACGGLDGIACASGFACDYGDAADGTCGRSGQMGTCIERPPACYGYIVPSERYCGCAGERGYFGSCPDPRPFPPGTYATCDGVDDVPNRCGPWLECRGRQYCVRRPLEPAGTFEYACETLEVDQDNPTSASCDALRAHDCGANCAQVGEMVLLTCECAG